MDYIEALNWRYATKKMNGISVSDEKVDKILEAARLAPTSSGLQPFQIYLITDPTIKAQIAPIAYNQSQIIDCSHLVVFAAWDKYTNERIDTRFDYTNTFRGLPLNTNDEYKKQLKAQLCTSDIAAQAAHTAKQSYIAFSSLLMAAAIESVDATPMEGFNNEALDTLLGLSEQGLKSTTMVALGYRDDSQDWLVNLAKVRTPKEDFITKL